MFESLARYYAIRAIVGISILVLVSIVGSCNEAKYALFARAANATIYRAYDLESRDAPTQHVVMYHFTDDKGEEQKDGFNEEVPGTFRPGTTIAVEYIPRHSRLVGEHQWIWPIILGSSLFLGMICCVPLILEARQATRELAASKKKYRY